jgi:hypothetical protein
VARYTGAMGHLLGDPFSVEAFQSSDLAMCKVAKDDHEVELSTPDVKVYETINELGGITTIGASSALLGKAKSTVTESLRKLFKAGFVRQTEVTLTPGLKSGRPNALYLADHEEKVELEDLHIGLSRSLITQFLVGHYGHKFAGYDSKKGMLTTISEEEEHSKYYIFFDDTRLGISTIVEAVLKHERAVGSAGIRNFRLILHHEKRLKMVEEELKDLQSQTKVASIFAVMGQIRKLEEQEKAAKKRANPAKLLPVST